MGDKNNISYITSSTTIKTGHSILKAFYATAQGDRVITVRDGTSDSDPVIFTANLTSATFPLISMPYINHPCRDGIRVQVVSGSTGAVAVVFE